MRYYDAQELHEAADLAGLIDAVEAGHKRRKPETADGLIGPENAQYLIRSAHDGSQLIGSKLITIFPDNPARDLPAVQALIVLFDANSGAPVAVLDATELTYWKTGADSALGSRTLSRQDARVLVMAGAGGLSPWLIRSHLVVRPGIERVIIWNRTSQRAADLAVALSREGIPAEPAGDLEKAVRQADIVSTATMSTQPIIKGKWFKLGTHIDLVGGYSSDTREADDDAVARSHLFVDCMESALDGVGDILAPLNSGIIARSDIRGDLFDLVTGAVQGREDADEITIFKNAGGAHLDLMVAHALIERIRQDPL